MNLYAKHRNVLGMALLSACCLFAAVRAEALDINDIKNLVTNKVPEEVIVNMLQQSAPIAMTDADAAALRSMGASESLIAGIRTAGGGMAVQAEHPGEYIMSDGTTAPVYSSESYSYPSTSSSGTVTYVDPGTGVTYVEPNVVYATPPPTVVYESPVVVTSPTYVVPSYPTYHSRPSVGISIGIGGGSRKHYRHHRRR